jgi:thioesterase domain-containing protein
VTDIAAIVPRQPRSSSKLLVPLRESGSLPPVFLVHGWHGQAFVTPGFVDAFDTERPVYSIQARGLADDSPPHRTVAAMSSDYLAEVIQVADGSTPVLVGICAGSVIAVEMARQASASGGGHMPVVMLDPPYPPYARSRTRRARELTAFYVALAPWRNRASRLVTNKVAERLRRRAERVGETDVDVSTLETEAAVRVALSVAIALRRHRPSRYDGPVSVIASAKRASRDIWGSGVWEKAVSGPIDVQAVGDDHLDALDPRNEAFRAALTRALEGS